MSKLCVITPVGPGHEKHVESAKTSVELASKYKDFFSEIEHIVVDDTSGNLGRSRARNLGIEKADSDWIFLLDADDLMLLHTVNEFVPPDDPKVAAIFGAVLAQQPASRSTEGAYRCGDAWVIDAIIGNNNLANGWDDLVTTEISGSLSMGAFFKREYLEDNLFLENLFFGEDFEFYLNLFSKFEFVKLKLPLALARTRIPSATGPRGYNKLDWTAACRPYQKFWRQRGRIPMTKEERQKIFGNANQEIQAAKKNQLELI